MPPTTWLRRAAVSLVAIALGSASLAIDSATRLRKLSWDDTGKAFRSADVQTPRLPASSHSPSGVVALPSGSDVPTSVVFSFVATNRTAEAIVIESVQPSCGCTTMDLPPLPWTLAVGASGTIRATIDVTGKYDDFEKTLMVETSAGPEILTMQLFLPPDIDPAERRARNLRVAAVDRQKVFRADCAKCHVPSLEHAKTGAALFQALCAICHEAEHRAEMVPDLAASKTAPDEAVWIKLIADGRERTLMPAFARERGGVLSAEQMRLIAGYAVQRFEAPAREQAGR